MPDLGGLLGQRPDQMRMGVAERVDRDACAEIEIARTVGGDRPGAFATLEGDGRAGIGRHEHGLAGGNGSGSHETKILAKGDGVRTDWR